MTQLDPAAHRTAVVEALGVLGSGPEERFDRITRMTQEAFGVPLTFLNLVHGDVVTAQSTQGWRQGGSAPAEQVFCSTTVLTDEPMVVPDATLDPRFRDLAAVTEQGIRFYAGAPLSMLDGTRVGTLCIMDATPRELSATDLDLLRDLARWAERELGHAIDQGRVTRVLEGLVPEPVEVPGHELDTLVRRSEAGGGDVADWRLASDGFLHVTVGSISAPGRASGLLASAVRGAVIARTETAVPDAIRGLEVQVTADLNAAGAVGSLFHLRLDPTSGHVVHGDAGLGLAMLLRADGGVLPLRSLDLPIGLQPEGVPRSPGMLDLSPGDRLVVCTEGVMGLDGIGSLDDLADLVRSEPTGAAAVERVRGLVPAGVAHDVTLVVLRRS